MDKLRSNRLFRCLVCLLLVCCILINCSPIRAHATAAGAAAIVKGSVVTGNPYVICGAALVALGIYAGVETGAFEAVVNSAVDFLDTAGGWIADGSMQLFKTVTAAGETTYYAAGELFETLRGFLFDSSVVQSTVPSISIASVGNCVSHPTMSSVGTLSDTSYTITDATAPVMHFNLCSNYHCTVFCSTESFSLLSNTDTTVVSSYRNIDGVGFYIAHNMLKTSDTAASFCNGYKYGITAT
ncbi:MAG: hypothetical protein IJZ38_03140, partial [Bacteroides sp.]|nr:hypothetical protein [Bacteroides sp.]